MPTERIHSGAREDPGQASAPAEIAFLASLSQEIRSPLCAILGMADLLLETQLSEEQERYVCTFQRCGRRLLGLLDNLLELAQVERGGIEIREEPFDLRHVVQDAVQIFALPAEKKRVSLAVDVATDVPRTVIGDPERLAEILTNLVATSLASTERGHVLVRVSETSADAHTSRLRFEVSDTGIGTILEEAQRIFDRRARTNAEIARRCGAEGLGLAICRELVERMGGTVGVASRAGGGQTFHVELPLRRPEPADPAVPADRSRGVEPVGEPVRPASFPRALGAEPSQPSCGPRSARAVRPRWDLGGPRILVVDDSEESRAVVVAYLRHMGCQIETAPNGRVALERVQSARFDLVFMDMQMRVMDGYAATQAIRAWERQTGREPVPILALTAYAFREEGQRCLEAGCDAHVPKPVAREALLDAIHRFVKPPPLRVQVDPQIADLLPDYIENRHRDVAALRAALPAGDFAALERIGHDMRGSGANYGLARISELGAEIEVAAKNGDGECLARVVDQLATYLEQVQITLD